MAANKDHSFWPYLAPMFIFLGLVELGGRAPEAAAGVFLTLRVVVPLGLVVWFASRGRYPELRGYPVSARGVASDVGIGLLGGAIWMAPYVAFPALGPEPGNAFDPQLMGEEFVALALGLRFAGYALATPFIEELFVRSWLLRYADVVLERRDFRKVPIARYTRRSFLTVVIYFTFSHAPWEFPVSLAWVLLTQWWFYRRGHLMSLVIVHAASNGGIFLAVVAAHALLTGADGAAVDWWFFL